MPTPPRTEPALPSLAALGDDLSITTPMQRRLALLRPFLGLLAYSLAAYAGWWWLTPILVFLIFVAVVTVTHDVVHGTLGLTRRQTDWTLFLMGAVLLESGHAYQLTHTQHHRVFPGKDDPEGDPARMGLWRAVLHGPLFLPRLWWWAFQKSRQDAKQRRWLLAEAAWAVSILVLGVSLWTWTPAVLIYALLAIVGSWSYSLLTVHLPHHDYGETPLTQTHTLRGAIIPALFLELTYHLEHHLYPQVPSHNLPKLSRRLHPYFQQAGVKPRKVF
ncbi:fatty acid desaturase family protein [Lignipirellula cremea]|uniref:Fatty acid desaturase n=1 Tax=Lignipirellula cremea TaxID=2528010 RepID=A0A518DWR3_9BACT|nr:fatty acid desaturase [Lignipirellula cremea]QDU96271.1 Fatty acid desaturase [Lignipirellula cremea]